MQTINDTIFVLRGDPEPEIYVHIHSILWTTVLEEKTVKERYSELFSKLETFGYGDDEEEELHISELKEKGVYDEKVYYKTDKFEIRILQADKPIPMLSFNSSETQILMSKIQEHLAQRSESLLREFYD